MTVLLVIPGEKSEMKEFLTSINNGWAERRVHLCLIPGTLRGTLRMYEKKTKKQHLELE